MADNTVLNTGTGGDTIASDDIVGVKWQRVKLTLGADGVNDGDISQANPVPCGQSGTWTVQQGGSPWGVSTTGTNQVAGTVTANAGTGTFIVNGSAVVQGVSSVGTLNVGDGGGSLTVDAPVGTPVAIRQSDGAAFIEVRGGDVAHDGIDSGNPVKVGGKAAGALPAAVAALDRVDSYVDREGRHIVRPWGAGDLTNVNFPAVNTRASSTRAAGAAGVRHVCTGLTVVLAAGATAPTAVQLDVRLRDGILDTGTILWQGVITLPATAGAMNGITRNGLFIRGTAATAMTLEFSAAGGANTFESVSFEIVDITEA